MIKLLNANSLRWRHQFDPIPDLCGHVPSCLGRYLADITIRLKWYVTIRHQHKGQTLPRVGQKITTSTIDSKAYDNRNLDDNYQALFMFLTYTLFINTDLNV